MKFQRGRSEICEVDADQVPPTPVDSAAVDAEFRAINAQLGTLGTSYLLAMIVGSPDPKEAARCYHAAYTTSQSSSALAASALFSVLQAELQANGVAAARALWLRVQAEAVQLFKAWYTADVKPPDDGERV